jgi:hypothetical protein
VTAPIIIVVAPVSSGPQKLATSSRVRAVAGSRVSGCSARPAQIQAWTADSMMKAVAPIRKTCPAGAGSRPRTIAAKTAKARAPKAAVQA